MDCPDCEATTLAFDLATEFRAYVPGDERSVALCTRCLSLHPAPEDGTTSDPDFTAISDAFPRDEAAIPMALVVGLLPSFALYRTEIEALVERVERAGTDPLLVLDRLAADPAIEPATDLRRRREQLTQVLG